MAYGNPPGGPPPGQDGPAPGYGPPPGSGGPAPGYGPPPGYPPPGYGPPPGYPPQGYGPPPPGYPPPGYGLPPGFQQPVPRPPRPAPVNAAVFLQLLAVGLGFVSIVMAFVIGDALGKATEKSLRDAGATSTEGVASGAAGASTLITACPVLFGVILTVLLAVFNLRGSNVSRIFTWVLSGAAICFGLASASIAIAARSRTEELTSGLDYQIPGWISVYNYASTGVTVVIYVLIAVLLALPASNAYFNPKLQNLQRY